MEGAILLWIQNNLRGGLDHFMTACTYLGNYGFIFILLGLVLVCIPKTRKLGLAMLTALTIGFLITNIVLKPLVDRTRPWYVVEGLVPMISAAVDDPSFPSGHSCAAFACAGTILFSRVGKGWKAIALGGAALMAFSRLYLGVHYPTDVLAGVAVGLFSGYLARRIWKTET